MILKFLDYRLDLCFLFFQHEGTTFLMLIFSVEPNVEAIDRKAGDVIKAFKDLVFPDDYNPAAKPAAKRKVHSV